MKSRQVELTEFSEIITNYTRDFVGREWLMNEVNQLLADSECRFILLTGNAGVGKTAFLAHLASQNPQWLRYFIRRDSLNLMSPGDAATFLLTVGGQFATLYPELFLPKNVQINVDQEIGNVTANGKLTGIHIDEVYASPFYKVALDVKQKIDELKGEAFAIKIGRLIREPRLLPMQTLQFLALLDPAKLLKIKEPETSLIILVDGLDELRYSPARPDILHALCELTDIPSNLRFIITSRPEQFLDQLLKRKDTKLFSLDTLELMEKKQADLQRYIHTLSKEELAKKLAERGKKNFPDQLLQKACGNFLYFKSVLRSIQEALENQQKEEMLEKLLNIDQLPDSLHELYNYFLDKIVGWAKQYFKCEAWVNYLTPLLGILSVTQEPLTEEQLFLFTQLTRQSIHDLLRELKQFIETVDERNPAYRIYHTSFVDNLRNKSSKYWIDPQDWHRRIVDHYWQNYSGHWNNCDLYGLCHLPNHILESEAIGESRKKLYGLLRQDDFIHAQIAKTQNYTRTYESFESALWAYITGESPEDDYCLCDLALRAGKLSSKAQTDITMAFGWAREGKMQEAIERISVINDEKEFFKAALLLLWIEAERQKKLPEKERSRKEAKLAMEAWKKRIPEESRSKNWEEFLSEDFKEAKQLQEIFSRRIPEERCSMDWTKFLSEDFMVFWSVEVRQILEAQEIVKIGYSVLNKIALEFARIGAFHHAVDIALTIKDDMDQSSALSEIAKAIAQAGNFQQALDTALTIKDDINQSVTLSEIAKAMAQIGNFQQALDTALTIKDDINQSFALLKVAQIIAQTGEFQKALDITLNLKSNTYTFAIFPEIVITMAHARAFQQALDTAESTSFAWYRFSAFLGIANAMLKTEKDDKVQKIIQKAADAALRIDTKDKKSYALSKIAETMVQIGTFQQAIDVALSIDDTTKKSSTLLKIAEMIAQAGIFQKAVDVALRIKDDGEKSFALSQIAKVIAQAGNKEGAHQVFLYTFDIAKNIKDEGKKSFVVSKIALAIAHSGNQERAQRVFLQALNITSDMDDADIKSSALSKIADAMAQAGAFQRALYITRSIQDNGTRYFALSKVAIAMAQVGAFQQALDITQSIHDNEKKFCVQLKIAQKIAQAGGRQKALEIALSIDYKSDSVLVRKAIALSHARSFQLAIDIVLSIFSDRKKSRVFSKISHIAKKINDTDGGYLEFWNKAMTLANEAKMNARGQCVIVNKLNPLSGKTGMLLIYGLKKIIRQPGGEEKGQKILLGAIKENPTILLRVAKKMGNNNREFQFLVNFLEKNLLSRTMICDTLHVLQQALAERVDSPLIPLRRTFAIFPFDYSLAYHSVYMLEVAHIKQKNWEHYRKIEECLKEHGLGI